MYCHGCAAKLDDADFYCRKCGEESAALQSATRRQSWLSTGGNFLIGAAGYAVFVFALFFLISTIFFFASPQLTIAVLFVLGALLAGLCFAISRNVSQGRRTNDPKKNRGEVTDTAVPQLADKPFFEAPESVTAPTTRELIKR